MKITFKRRGKKLKIQYIGLDEINGPLVYLKTPENISFDEQVKLVLENGEVRIGNVIMLNEDITVIQVYQGTNEMNLKGVKVELEGKPLQIKLSKEMLGIKPMYPMISTIKTNGVL